MQYYLYSNWHIKRVFSLGKTNKKQININPIKLRKNITIGSPDAEMDDEFLSSCFFETEDVGTLLDTMAPPRIIVGRTGAGKTALLRHIEEKTKNSVFLSPEDFSFRYLADSSVLNFFEGAGVNLNIFYLLLWRHVICVELIRKKYGIDNEDKMSMFLSSLSARIKGDKAKQQAFKYIEEWGNKFWETTEIRIKEITQKLEDDLSSKVSISTPLIKLGANGANKLTEEQKLEVVNIGKDIVNKIQVQKLSNVINLLDEEIFNDPNNPFYILIDQLDENWAEESLRYKIIRSLIDNIKKFQRVRNVKIIISLREDLLQRVIRETKDSGFQEEKIESLYLRLNWTTDELEQILDLRVGQLFKRQYNKSAVKVRDILSQGNKEDGDALQYILSRTFMRPREAILFINYCLQEASGKDRIPFTTIAKAEFNYSRKRIASLSDEWVVDFPLLSSYLKLLYGFDKKFILADLLKSSNVDDILLDAACNDKIKCDGDHICRLSQPYLGEGKNNKESLMKSIICVFYQVGVVGVRLQKGFPIEWSYESAPLIEEEQLSRNTSIHVHKTFWRALSIKSD